MGILEILQDVINYEVQYLHDVATEKSARF